ncbi:anti-repressor SinI family protein [Metabacillus litoralis]|uniref:anti-repressor SinI family protein n=1 Tax=Metabacillus litoralis TaxID=152268 RepID=UPI001CFEEE07|nr:anti-repressor SinI family protein [Metabacillus litoralis]
MKPVQTSLHFEGKELDYEWTVLIKEALEMGITKEEIISFLQTFPFIDQKH